MSENQRDAHRQDTAGLKANPTGLARRITLKLPSFFNRSRRNAAQLLPATTVESDAKEEQGLAGREYVLLSVREKRLTTRLIHTDLTYNKDDEGMFKSIQLEYNKVKWWRWARVNVLSHIEWKRVSLPSQL